MNFKVGLSRDLDNGAGAFTWGDIAIDTLAPLSWSFLTQSGSLFRPPMTAGFDGIIFAGPGVDEDSFSTPEESPIIISRLGVGYDTIDLAACTRAGVALTITPDGSQKPVATAALTLLLSTMHKVVAKDHQARDLDWANRIQGLGTGLNGKVVGTIGLGNIATEFFRLIAPFDTTRLSYDPWKYQEEALLHNVELVDLKTLMQRCDAIVVMAVLTPETRHLISRDQFKEMKNSAFIINISRGPIIDEAALIEALNQGEIAGAGLDVFEIEPLDRDNSLLALNNVIVTPHNLAWTDELALGMGASAIRSIKAISVGDIPQYVVNKEVLETPQFLSKIARFTA